METKKKRPRGLTDGVTEWHLTGICQINVDLIVKFWTRNCFVYRYDDQYNVCSRKPRQEKAWFDIRISQTDAKALIERLVLIETPSTFFRKSSTYRRAGEYDGQPPLTRAIEYDFYFSMSQARYFSRSNETGLYQIGGHISYDFYRQLSIHGELFTFCIEKGQKHGVSWEDLRYVTTGLYDNVVVGEPWNLPDELLTRFTPLVEPSADGPSPSTNL